MPFADRLCALVEARLPLAIESDGSEDDWDVVGPATLVAATRHLRAIAHLQESFPSKLIGWQLVRSMFEYVASYAWIAADPATRAQQWLKYDYVYRKKVVDDFRRLGEALLEEDDRQRIEAFLPDVVPMPDLASRTRAADDVWAERLQELDGYLPEEFRGFQRLYALIYRTGSQFTHPSSHVVNRFTSRDGSQIIVGDERPGERDLALVGSGVLAAGLAIAGSATPALGLSLDDIRQALTE